MDGWHKHPNGGGLVQDTACISDYAWISDDAWVYGDARIYGNARIFGDARIYGNAQVSGDAWVYGDARVSGDAWPKSPLHIKGPRHSITLSTYNTITIGCLTYTLEQWKENFRKIGELEKYEPEEIELYGLLIETICRYAQTLQSSAINQNINQKET